MLTLGAICIRTEREFWSFIGWGHEPQGCERPDLGEGRPLRLNFGLRVARRKDPMGGQALVPEPPAEGLDENFAGRLACPGEVPRHPIYMSPVIERAANNL